MTVKATVEEVREAHSAFTRINEEVRLPQKPAWRVARLINKLKPHVKDYEDTILKLFKDAGGVQGGRGIEIQAPEREDGEDAVTWKARMDEYREKLNKLNEETKALNAEEIEIDYDKIPLSLFDEDEKTPKEKQRQYSANDFARAMPFIDDGEKKAA